jgi:hypothetical protein
MGAINVRGHARDIDGPPTQAPRAIVWRLRRQSRAHVNNPILESLGICIETREITPGFLPRIILTIELGHALAGQRGWSGPDARIVRYSPRAGPPLSHQCGRRPVRERRRWPC